MDGYAQQLPLLAAHLDVRAAGVRETADMVRDLHRHAGRAPRAQDPVAAYGRVRARSRS